MCDYTGVKDENIASMSQLDVDIDCTRLELLEFSDLETREPMTSNSKSCLHSRRNCIQGRFKDLLYDYYHPVDSKLTASNASESSNIFFFTKLDSLVEISPTDFETVSFRHPENDTESSLETFGALQDVPILPEPLFLQLWCTAEINGSQFCEIHLGSKLPTCLKEIYQHVYDQVKRDCFDSEESSAEKWLPTIEAPLDIRKLRVCLKFDFLHLAHVDNLFTVVKEFESASRVRTSSSVYEYANSSVYENSNGTDMDTSLIPKHVPNQDDFLERMRWFISDVVATCLHDSITPIPLGVNVHEKIKQHVKAFEPSHSNSDFRELNLKFVENSLSSFDLLEKELKKFEWKNFKVRQLGYSIPMYSLYVDKSVVLDHKISRRIKHKTFTTPKRTTHLSGTSFEMGSECCGDCHSATLSRGPSGTFVSDSTRSLAGGPRDEFMSELGPEFTSPFMKEFEECLEIDNPMKASSIIDGNVDDSEDREASAVAHGFVNDSLTNVGRGETLKFCCDYDADTSNCMDSISVQDQEALEDFRPKNDSFWMVFELDMSSTDYCCRIYLHKAFCCEYDIAGCCSDDAFREFEVYVQNSVHKVNQIKLLEHFYNNEYCLPILLNDTSEFSAYQESLIDWRELVGTADFSEWDPDQFRCQEVKRIVIPIHVRIQPANPKSGSVDVTNAVVSLFQKCGIKNARVPPNVSLYRTEDGHVFYFKCSIEDNTSKKATGGKNSDGALGSSHNANRYGEVFQPSQSVSYSSPRIKYSLVVNIFGVGELDWFLKSDLQTQIEAALRDKTLSQLWNAFVQSQCKLYNADVELLQPKNSAPNIYYFDIPNEFYTHLYHLMWHLKTNVSLYTVEPKYWNSDDHDFHFKGPNGEQCQSVNSRLFINIKDDSPHVVRTAAVNAKRFRSRSDPGIALLEFGIVSPFEQNRKSEMSFGFEELNKFSSLTNLPCSELVPDECLRDDKYYLRFSVWETGKIDRDKLLNKVLFSCVNQALCDVYIEYKLLHHAPVSVEGPVIKDVNHVDLFSLPPESHLGQHRRPNPPNVDNIAFYLNSVFPWLTQSHENSNCLSVCTHKCTLNFRQRLSEFFFAVQSAIKQDNKGTEFVWLLYRNKNGRLLKMRDQSLTKALTGSEMGLDFPELILPPQTEIAEYYFLAFNPSDWSFSGRSRHASGSSESKFSISRHQVVNVPKDILVDSVNRRSVIIGKFQNRELSSVAYNIPTFANFFSQFDEKAQSMNFDSRVLNCIVRQKMGLYNHQCFADTARRGKSRQQRSFHFHDKFKEHRLNLDPKCDMQTVDEVMKYQPNFYNKIVAAQEKSSTSKTSAGRSFVPKVKVAFVEALKQFALTYEYKRSKNFIADYMKKFETCVFDQKRDSLTISRDELDLIMSRSRLYHYITTPMFFATSWQKMVTSSAMEISAETSNVSNSSYDERKQSIINTFSEKFDHKVRLEISNPPPVLTQRVKHLSGTQTHQQAGQQTLFFPGSVGSHSRDHDRTTAKFTRYVVRSVNYGGVAILKFGFYIKEYDCFFCVQLNTFLFRKNGGANSFELFDDYYQKLDYLLQNLHVHSFAYDLQLQMIWSYILEKNAAVIPLTYPELESSQRNILKFLMDFIKFHHGKAPASSVKRLLSKQIRISLGVGDDIDPKQFYEYLVDRKEQYNIVCISVPGLMGKTALENTTLITRSYNLPTAHELESLAVGQLKCILLFAHDSFEKTEHKHRKHAGQACNEQLCCKYDLRKTGKEKILLIRYFLILSSEIVGQSNPLLQRFKSNLRPEERRKVSKIEHEMSKSLNDLMSDQDRVCTSQIQKVLERVKKDFHRDLLLNKIVDCCSTQKTENSTSVPSEQPQTTSSSRAQTFSSVFNSSDTKKKISSSSSAMLTQSQIFQSCLNEKESLMLLDFFLPISVDTYLQQAQNEFTGMELDSKASDIFTAKFSGLIELIMPKIDEFLLALSKIAFVHVLTFSSELKDTFNISSQNTHDFDIINQSYFAEKKSIDTDSQCALIFKRNSGKSEFSTLPFIPQFLLLVARSGNIPAVVYQKLKNSANYDSSVSLQSCHHRAMIDSKLMIASTVPLRHNKKHIIYSKDNIDFIRSVYNFMIYFSFLN